MVKTKFTYDEQSLIEFFSFHLKRKDKIRYVYYGISLLFTIIGIILLFIIERKIFGFITFIASAIMFLAYPSRTKRAAKKTSESRYKRAPQTIIFYDDKIEQHTDKQIIVYKWDLVKDVHETPKYIYFYVSKQGALIVNKATITDSEHDQLIGLIKNNKKDYYIYSR